MVFTHNKQLFDHDDSLQFSFQHVRHLDYGGPFATSGQRHIHDRQHFPDGIRGNMELENLKAVNSADNRGCNPDNKSNLTWVMETKSEIERSENSKRPFDDVDDLQITSKRTRQMDGCFPPSGSTISDRSPSPSSADDESWSRKDAAVHESCNDFPPCSSSNLPWFPCGIEQDDTRLEPPVRLSFFPGYYEDHHRPFGYRRVEECQSPVFSYLPQKLVAIGPDHQADIPEWRPKDLQERHGENGSDVATSSGHILIDDNCCDKWVSYCVMPMPDSSSSSLDGCPGRSGTDCCCLDEGSIRCVKQHVMEAREDLRSSLGHERFLELGFCEMGEDVALEWSEEEEQLFHEVVISNPATMGKDFWDHLGDAFPSRSSKELVSYYFNVFMLRKRAEQNRFDPFNVDSDNDEWQDNDDGEFVGAQVEDEDDSGVESPADAAAQDNGLHGAVDGDILEEVEDDCSDDEEYATSDGFPGDSKPKYGPHFEHHTDLPDCPGEDRDVHDDSCTSYEGQQNGADLSGGGVDVLEGARDSAEEAEHGNFHSDFTHACMGGMNDHDLVGHCDLKPWEFGYIRGLDKDLEFLPTCNVIEEVFGSELWEKSREGHGVS